MIKENYEERIEIAILKIAALMQPLEMRMRKRIAANCINDEVQFCLQHWNFLEPKFKFWGRRSNLRDHYNDLNVWEAYNRTLIILKSIQYDGKQNI